MQLLKIKLGGIKEICQLSRNCAQIAEVKLRGRVGRLMSARFMPPSRLMQNRHGKNLSLYAHNLGYSIISLKIRKCMCIFIFCS